MQYLITKWFGTFLCDERGVKDSILFPKKAEEISKILKKINRGLILQEERILVKGKKVIVNEKRLKSIGYYNSSDPFFKDFEISAEDYNYSTDLLRKALILIARYKIEKKLESKDIQIIQLINALDDMIHISNLLSSRLNAWSETNMPKRMIKFLERTNLLIKEKIAKLEEHIDKDMKNLAPNISSIIGTHIGARLIALAGGLERLAKLPASSIQILGAEKAIFRYKKEGGKPPKHGVIFCHPLINKSEKNVRGKIARIIATKLATAAKADVFTKRDISKSLKEEIEKKLKRLRICKNINSFVIFCFQTD